MKLATWNCCGQFDTKLPLLFDLAVDVAVVCEATALSAWPISRGGRLVTGLSRRVWTESWKELAVVAVEPWSATPHEAAESAPVWTLPVRVSGPTPFTLVALWPVLFPGAPGYVEQIDGAAEWIERNAADGPVVLAGDFNAPIASTQSQYEKVVRRLESLGLVDAYRLTRGLERGEHPTEATYYHHRRRDKPFHIDHVMLPAPWADVAKIEVGDFQTWIAPGFSDHVPVIADIHPDDLLG